MADNILPTWRLRATLVYGYANLWYAQQYSPKQVTDKITLLTCRLRYIINMTYYEEEKAGVYSEVLQWLLRSKQIYCFERS